MRTKTFVRCTVSAVKLYLRCSRFMVGWWVGRRIGKYGCVAALYKISGGILKWQ